jgi:peptidoglycan hydrolase CwlO-like protein
VEDGSVDHVVARDARSLRNLIHDANSLEAVQKLIEEAQESLAHHPEDDEEDDLDHEDDRERD